MVPFIQRLLTRAEATMAPVEPSAASPVGQASTTPPMPVPTLVPELLHESEVSTSMLLRLFRQCYLPVESLPGDRLLVTTDHGMRLQVLVDEARQLIGLFATYGLNPEATLPDKLAFVNRVNDEVVFVRFSLLGEDTLYVDHHLPFDGGITAAAVVCAVRRMGRITPQAILAYAPAGLMG